MEIESLSASLPARFGDVMPMLQLFQDLLAHHVELRVFSVRAATLHTAKGALQLGILDRLNPDRCKKKRQPWAQVGWLFICGDPA